MSRGFVVVRAAVGRIGTVFAMYNAMSETTKEGGKMISHKSQTAARYLRAAATSVEIYGEKDPVGMLVAELYGAAAYGEGDVMEIAQRLAAARHAAIEEE